MLNWGFANYALARADLDLELTPVPVRLGRAASVQPELPDGGPILIRKEQRSAIRRELSLAPELDAPVERGQVIGSLRIYAGEELLRELDLTASADVPRLTFGEIWLRVLRAACGGG